MHSVKRKTLNKYKLDKNRIYTASGSSEFGRDYELMTIENNIMTLDSDDGCDPLILERVE